MEQLALTFFPFPHVHQGERSPGLAVDWAERCQRCTDRQCEKTKSVGLQVCPWGINFQRVDQELLIAGIVVKDFPGPNTQLRGRAIRRAGSSAVKRADVDAVVLRASRPTAALQADLEIRIAALADQYRESDAFKSDLIDHLRPDLQSMFGQVHDYKQFVQQILHNMEVVLRTRYEGSAIEDLVDSASHEERSIYWAARLMDEKLDSALYMLYPDRILDRREFSCFRFHGLVTKYKKIYRSNGTAQGLIFQEDGESWGEVEGNGAAISIIPHAFIDNAVKYAPAGSTIRLCYYEQNGLLDFAVESFGPRIDDDEIVEVFSLFVRGRSTASTNVEGTGIGLAAAANVAETLGFEIWIDQKHEIGGPDNTFLTTAHLRIPILNR